MLGPMISLTTSIATVAAVGVARAGAAAVVGGAGHQVPVRRPRQTNHVAVHQLIEALENERERRRAAEAEVATLRLQLAVAGDVIERLQD